MVSLLIHPNERTCLKLSLELANKVRKQIRHCFFFLSYGFHSLQKSLMLLRSYVRVFGLLIFQGLYIKLEELIS